MCGIFGYIGQSKKTVGSLLEGLRRLEYRGYDSAGVAFGGQGKIFWRKTKGRVSDLQSKLPLNSICDLAIFHTRWATHGKPSDQNAHPHFDCNEKIFVVHNGIIENYKELKEKLIELGHNFRSETDTEVVPHLIEEILKRRKYTLEEATFYALQLIKGSYALAIMHSKEEKIVVARYSSPVIIGLGNSEHFIASDPSAILPFTREVIFLEDGEYAVIEKNRYQIFSGELKSVSRISQTLEWEVNQTSKKGFSHFMLKEIFEEPEAVDSALRGRIIESEGNVKLGGLENVVQRLKQIERLIITGCGTAYYAGLVGEYLIENLAGIPVEVELASEFRYRNPAMDSKTALLAISQSGETADTLAAVREAKQKNIFTLGIVNVVGSTIAREVEAGIYNHAGPEIAVASTKAFISQLTVLALLGIFLGRQRRMSQATGKKIIVELQEIPSKIKEILSQSEFIKNLAKKYLAYENFFYISRRYNYPVALEGALKLKEVAYIHAEGYGAGEMKHGPIALINKNFPSFVIAPEDEVYEKIASNAQEIKAREGKIIAVLTEGDKKISQIADDAIYIPKTLDVLTPLLTTPPLHLFAYYTAVLRGHDVDKPRNLAKSVTVE